MSGGADPGRLKDGEWLLVLREEGGEERSIPLGGEPLIVGRGRECQVRLERPEVSRRHLELRREEGRLLAWDLGSAAGTLLNGARLEGARALAPGDVLRVGGADLRVVLRAAAPRTGPEGSGAEPAASVLSGDRARDERNVELLLRTIAELHAASDLEELLRGVIDRAIAIAGGSRGALLLRRPGEEGLEGILARDRDGRDLPAGEVLTRTIPVRALSSRRAVALTDTAAPEQRAEAPASVISGALGSVIAVPLHTAGGALGVLYVDSRRPAEGVGPSELAFFEALAAQAAIAIERARAAEALERRLAAERGRLERENQRLKEHLGAVDPLGESPAMTRAVELARRVAPSDLTVLVTGETGSGKEVLARLIHRLSPRAERPFVVVDCGALPENLVESELFGHERGAFTGAVEPRAGRFRDAHGGTILLDEIGELPLALQPKLLRVLQERAVTPLGGRAPVRVDVRVLAATHRDLAARVKEGTFREDLFYRLSAMCLAIPPLRERGDDVVLLANAFLARFGEALSRSLKGFTREALEAIRAHPWAGNVRELEHAIHRAAVLAEPPYVSRRDLCLGPDAAAAGDLPLEDGSSFPLLKAARATASERFERAYVADALKREGGNVTRAAKLAGVSRQLFQRLVKRHGLREQPGE